MILLTSVIIPKKRSTKVTSSSKVGNMRCLSFSFQLWLFAVWKNMFCNGYTKKKSGTEKAKLQKQAFYLNFRQKLPFQKTSPKKVFFLVSKKKFISSKPRYFATLTVFLSVEIGPKGSSLVKRCRPLIYLFLCIDLIEIL